MESEIENLTEIFREQLLALLEECGRGRRGLFSEYEHLGGYTLEAQAREVLAGLGFQDDQTARSAGTMWRASSVMTSRWPRVANVS